MRKSLTFNGERKSWLYLLEGRSKSPFAPIRNNLLHVPGMPGAYIQSVGTDVLYINQPIGFIVNDDEHALQLKDELAEWLITDKPVELQFDDEPGRTYYAKIEGTIDDFQRFVNQRKGVITFLCADPFAYGPEENVSFESDIVTIENKGTADSEPIFEMEVLAPITFAMIQNQNEEYQMIGRPASVDEQVVDTKNLLFLELGNTLDTWSTTPTQVDGGVVAGSMNTDGAGITVANYGTGASWHGPALIKEVPPVQDFEVEAHMQGRVMNPNQNFRIELYLFDEGMNVLGKISVLDKETRLYQMAGEARIGPYVADRVNYLISSSNYLYNWDYFFGMFRIRRVGNQFEFYITRINEANKHVFSIRETFEDAENKFAGRLKYIQIHIGKYGTTGTPYSAKFFSVSAYELTQTTIDQTPYIAQPGDIITFDHVNDELLINGEDRTDIHHFGGQYFKLAKGENQLMVFPEESLAINMKYRERFR